MTPVAAGAAAQRGGLRRGRRRARAPRRPPGGVRAARTWTSAATHAVLPLLATGTGSGSSSARGSRPTAPASASGTAGCGCRSAGTRRGSTTCSRRPACASTCVDWTDVLGPGPQAPRRTRAGVVVAPLDREAIELVWHPRGYPARAPYLDTHRLTERPHRAWANDGVGLRPRPRRRRGGRRRRGLRDARGRARRPVGGRARHRAARPLLARGRRLAARRARRVRAARRRARRRPRPRPAEDAPAAPPVDLVGRRAATCGRGAARRRGPRVGAAAGRAAGVRGPRRPSDARCAS